MRRLCFCSRVGWRMRLQKELCVPDSCSTSSSTALRPSITGRRTLESPDDSSSTHGVSRTLLRTRCTSLIHVSHTRCFMLS